jgi:hypothetical protein
MSRTSHSKTRLDNTKRLWILSPIVLFVVLLAYSKCTVVRVLRLVGFRIFRADCSLNFHCLTAWLMPLWLPHLRIRVAVPTILAAAEIEFATNGFAAARTENIAARANVAKGLIFHLFLEQRRAL